MPKTFDDGEPLRDQLPILTNLSILSESVEVFLRHLGKEHIENHWNARSSKEVLNKLTKDDVTNVRLLAMCWSDVEAHFPLGMKKTVEKELKSRNMIY